MRVAIEATDLVFAVLGLRSLITVSVAWSLIATRGQNGDTTADRDSPAGTEPEPVTGPCLASPATSHRTEGPS